MAAILLDEVRLNEGLRDRERLVKVESLLEESHKHVATREDVQAVRTELVGVQAALQSEISGVQAALQEDVQAVRTELVGVQAALQSEIADVRSELKTEIAGVQATLQSEISGVQATLQSEISGVRSELKSDIAGVRVDVQSVRTELADVKSDMRWLKWLLGTGASLGVAIGTGILLLLLRMAGGL